MGEVIHIDTRRAPRSRFVFAPGAGASRPDPACNRCGGRGWYPYQYEQPGNRATQSTVRVCECTGRGDGA